jgi:hypothetical protein
MRLNFSYCNEDKIYHGIKSLWFILTDKPRIETRLRIFCFPYSGVVASIFYDWSKHFPQDISIMATTTRSLVKNG